MQTGEPRCVTRRPRTVVTARPNRWATLSSSPTKGHAQRVSKIYVHLPVRSAELLDLVGLSKQEENAFFARNPRLSAPYRDRLLAVALCQGAALQYLGRGRGVADFDVHYFYRQNPTKRRLSRTVKHVVADVGGFRRIPVDFVRTVIPASIFDMDLARALDLLRAFLHEAPTENARHLATKAVIGLRPRTLFKTVIWPVAQALSARREGERAYRDMVRFSR
jgi:hypothetical protein